MEHLKKCCGCQKIKPREDFQKCRTTKDGLQDYCKTCRKEFDRKTYLNRSSETKARYKKLDRERRIKRARMIWEILKKTPCPCGESDPTVLDFDHVKGEKHFNISDWIRTGRREKLLWQEIEKCQVLCANCHRRKTAKSRKHLRWLWSMEHLTPT